MPAYRSPDGTVYNLSQFALFDVIETKNPSTWELVGALIMPRKRNYAVVTIQTGSQADCEAGLQAIYSELRTTESKS